jgi:hypothetical protein
VTTYRYLTAAQWGMRWARPPVAELLGDREAFVHHTAGSLISQDAATAFRALNEYAINSKGYSAVDYDILVHRSTTTGVVTIGEARGAALSAATLHRNEEGEAVCLMGYFQPGHALSRQPHPDEVEGVARAIVHGINKGWIAKTAAILGHRDNPAHPGATSCPGDYLYAKLPTIRTRVAQLLAPPPPPENDDVNWNPSNTVVASVKSPAPAAETLAGKWNDWAVISLIKSLEEEYGLPITGRYSQALVDRMLKTLA